MFHAVVNGRKKYGAVGWSAPYQFSSADLQVNTVCKADSEYLHMC